MPRIFFFFLFFFLSERPESSSHQSMSWHMSNCVSCWLQLGNEKCSVFSLRLSVSLWPQASVSVGMSRDSSVEFSPQRPVLTWPDGAWAQLAPAKTSTQAICGQLKHFIPTHSCFSLCLINTLTHTQTHTHAFYSPTCFFPSQYSSVMLVCYTYSCTVQWWM